MHSALVFHVKESRGIGCFPLLPLFRFLGAWVDDRPLVRVRLAAHEIGPDQLPKVGPHGNSVLDHDGVDQADGLGHAVDGHVAPDVVDGMAVAAVPGACEAAPEARHVQGGLPVRVVHVLLPVLQDEPHRVEHPEPGQRPEERARRVERRRRDRSWQA